MELISPRKLLPSSGRYHPVVHWWAIVVCVTIVYYTNGHYLVSAQSNTSSQAPEQPPPHFELLETVETSSSTLEVVHAAAGEEGQGPPQAYQPVSGTSRDLDQNNTELWFFNSLLKDYDRAVYPTFRTPGIVTVVKCSISISSISSVSAADMEFTVDMFLRQTWYDPRLAQSSHPAAFRLNDETLIRLLWRPDIYFPDVKKAVTHRVTAPNIGMIIQPNGSVFSSERLTLTFSCNMNLFFFPFDMQRCYIKLGSYFHPRDQLKLRWEDAFTALDFDYIQMPQLKITRSSTDSMTVSTVSGDYSQLRATIVFQRESGYDMIQTYIPSFMIVMISWVSCWLDVNAIPARTTLGVTTLLTVTTQSSGVRASLPPVSYVKGVDIWLGTCTCYVFAVLLEFTFVNYLARTRPTKIRRSDSQRHIVNPDTGKTEKWMSVQLSDTLKPKSGDELTEHQRKYVNSYVANKRKQAVRVDKLARALFPLTFLIFNFIYWPYFLGSSQF